MPLALASGLAILALASSTAGAADIADSFVANGHCLTGTYTVPHGVTQVRIHARGAIGGDGYPYDAYSLNGTLEFHNAGGQGGWGSEVDTTLSVSPGERLYVGVANAYGQVNAFPGGAGDEGEGAAGNGGAASWVSTAPPTTIGSSCFVSKPYLQVVAAGGGGGGTAGSRQHVYGGAGGTEAYGGDGSTGGNGFASQSGGAGGYSRVTMNSSNDIAGTAGGGGGGGHSYGCSGGDAGTPGAFFGDPTKSLSPPASSGGGAGATSGRDCSTPASRVIQSQFDVGGAGGGGGGGLYSGGGGGGSDDSGTGSGAGGASGTSYSRDPSFSVASEVHRWTGDPEVDIESVTIPPAITSANHATFTAGTPGSFEATATGADTPFVLFRGTEALQRIGLDDTPITQSDGSGGGASILSGTPTKGGVYGATVEACNSIGCADQGFTLTVNEAPGLSGGANYLFAQNQQNTVTIGASGYPAPAITATGGSALSWLTVTDNGDGTATLSGTPPAGASPNTYTVDLRAANGIGAAAHATETFTIVSNLAMSPTSTHLVPGFSFDVLRVNPDLFAYQRDSQQQFTATGTRPDGSTFDASNLALWSSSNTAAVGVTASGFATAAALGTSTLTAGTYGALNTTATVFSAVPLSISVTPDVLTITTRHTQQFVATGCYADPCASNSFDITSHVNWSVAPNDDTMTIDQNGFARAGLGGGPAVSVVATQFTSASPFEQSGYADVTVTHGDVTSIDLTPPGTTTITTNGLATYKATVHYEDGSQSTSTIVNWSEQDVSGLNVAYVGQNIGSSSQLISLHTGTATVTASYHNADGTTASASATLKVITVPRTLTVSGCTNGLLTPQGAPLIPKGQTCQLTATARLNDGTSVDVTHGVTWSSSDPTAFTISSTGLLTATGSQEGAISNVSASYAYTDTNGSAATLDSNHVLPQVTLLPPVSLSITPASLSTLHPGAHQQFTATATYADGSTEDVTHAVSNLGQIQWSVDSDIAQSVSGGLLQIIATAHATLCKAQSPCTVHVHATIPPVGNNAAVTSNTVAVTVVDPLDHITLTGPASYSTTAGQSVGFLHAEGWDSFGHDLGDVTQDSTFTVLTSDGNPDPNGSCSNFPVSCTITDADTGNGSTFHTVTASDPNAATPLSTDARPPSAVDVTVSHGPVDHVVVTGGNRSVNAGEDTRPFDVTAYDQYANTWDVTGFTVFSVSPSEHVQFGGQDYFNSCDTPTWATCRAYVAGQHTISAVYHAGQADERDLALPLYVDASPAVTQIALSGGPSDGEVAVGGTTDPYVATITDRYGNTGAGTNVVLTILPDGTCDETTETCVPATAGAHTVQAEAFDKDGNLVYSNTVALAAVTPDHLQLSGSSSIGAGDTTAPYTVQAYDSSGHSLGDVTANSTLSIAPDGSCDSTADTCTASVPDSGGSSHTVTATYAGAGGATGTASLTVVGVDHIQLLGDTSPLRAGDNTNAFHVEGYTADNTDLGAVTAAVTLSISPDGTCDQTTHTCTATVADTNGSRHTITATYNGGSNPTSSLQIEVDPDPILASLELRGGSASIAAGDSTAPFQVEGLDQYGNDVGDATSFIVLTIGPNQVGESCNQSLKTCTATTADTNGSHHTITAIVPGGGGTIRGTADLTVDPGPTASLVLTGGNDSVEAGFATNPYTVHGSDAYGNDTGDVTAESTLSISPDGTCDQTAATCTGLSADSESLATRHTITATDGSATATSTVFVTPNDPPFPLNQPALDDGTQQYNTDGNFSLIWGPTQDPNGDPLTYTLQQKSSAPGSQWHTVASGLTCNTGHNCSYAFGGANPSEEQGTWTFRMLVTDGFSVVTSPESDPVYVDHVAPTVSDDVSHAWATGPETVTLNADDGQGSGVYATYFQVAGDGTPTPGLPANPQSPAVNDPTGEWFYYFDGDLPVLANDQLVFYYSVDNTGNTTPVETSAVARIDGTPPTTTDNVPGSMVLHNVVVTLNAQDQGDPSNPWAKSGVAFTYYEIGTPGSTPDPTTASPVYTLAHRPILTNGQELKYFSVDRAGNAEPVETSQVAQVDTPPTTTIDLGGHTSGKWSSTDVTFSLTATPGVSPVAHTYYTLDGGSPVVYAGPATVGAEGKHVLRYYSVDQLGVVEQFHAVSIPIDKTAPLLSGAPTTNPNGNGWYNGSVAIHWSCSDALSGVSSCPGNSTITTQGAALTVNRLDTDGAGNTTLATSSPAVNIDKTPPVTTGVLSTGGFHSGSTYAGPVTLTLTPADALSGLGTTSYSLDGGSTQTYAAPVSLDTVGAHTFRFWSTDLAGNVEPQHVLSLTVIHAPAAPVLGSVSQGVRSLGVSWSAPADTAGEPVRSYLVTYVNRATSVSVTRSVSAPASSTTLTGLANGAAYSVSVAAKNDAGTGPSSAAQVQSTYGLPDAPVSFAAVRGDGTASLSWQQGAQDGGTPVTSYALTFTTGVTTTNQGFDAATACTLSGCTAHLSGLGNGSNYVLRLWAFNAAGKSSSYAQATVTPNAVRGAPTSLAAAGGVRSVALTWEPPSQTGAGVSSYTITLTGGASLIVPSVTGAAPRRPPSRSAARPRRASPR